MRSDIEPLEHIMRALVAAQGRDSQGCCRKASVRAEYPIKFLSDLGFLRFDQPVLPHRSKDLANR
jgi:hypothetical protein